MAFSDYSSTPSSNVSIGGVNIGEGCAPANLNDAIRQFMADAKTFSDTALSTTANVSISATYTYTSVQNYNDGVAVRFGTDRDLNIQHSGTDSRITHDGTGDFILRTSSNILLRNAGGTETMAAFATNGAATLYYDNAAKLATATGGVSVTGNVTLTTDLMISEAADHTSTPAAGKAILWSRNDAPNVLVFTDDVGTDHVLASRVYVSGGASALTTLSGAAVDFTAIPSGVTEIDIIYVASALSGTDSFLTQIGDSGGVETASYVSSSGLTVNGANGSVVSSTSGFPVTMGDPARAAHGIMRLRLADSATNLWVAEHSVRIDTTITACGGGSKALSATLDRVRIAATGANTLSGQVVARWRY